MKLTNREKILLPLVLMFLIAAIFINNIFVPINTENSILKTQIKNNKVKILDMQAKEDMNVTLDLQAKALKDKVMQDNKDVLTVWDQAAILASIEDTISDLADKKSIDFYDIVNTSSINAGVVTVVADTNYDNLQIFLEKMEKGKYFNTISRVGVNKLLTTAGQNSNNEIEVSLDITFYSTTFESTYPDKYDFMNANVGKIDIFK